MSFDIEISCTEASKHFEVILLECMILRSVFVQGNFG